MSPFLAEVSGETVAIPYRMNHDQPPAGAERSLTAAQRLILLCLHFRHRDGRVRQRHLEQVGGSGEPWVVRRCRPQRHIVAPPHRPRLPEGTATPDRRQSASSCAGGIVQVGDSGHRVVGHRRLVAGTRQVFIWAKTCPIRGPDPAVIAVTRHRSAHHGHPAGIRIDDDVAVGGVPIVPGLPGDGAAADSETPDSGG